MSHPGDSPVVLVTGAARRLGRVAAETFAARGWDVVAHSRPGGTDTAGTADAIRSLGRHCWTVEADLLDPAECRGLVARAAGLAGRLDGLVNNASLFEPGRLSETPDERLDRLLGVNLRAPFVLTRELAAVTRRGLVINLLDARIESLDWTHAAYTLTKQGLAAMTRLAALELAPGIRVNGIAPGPVLAPADRSEDYRIRRVAKTPLRRLRGAEDVAAALGWLLDADFVTGQVIFVDGGQHLTPYQRGPGGDCREKE